jgi:hypothetical protein
LTLGVVFQYLQQIKEYREEGRPIIYMDETYIHSSHTTPYAWSDGSIQELLSPVSKGQRLIVIHAGGEQGFIPNAYVLVIDNAPYHNVQLNRAPNSNSRRDFMISWLKNHLPPITFNNTDFSSLRNPNIL